MNNKHKDMILVKMWLTKAEFEKTISIISDYKKYASGNKDFVSNLSEVIIDIEKRGDFKW